MNGIEPFPLLQVRVLFDLHAFVQSQKNDVATGIKTPGQAALHLQLYGQGLAKALSLTEDLFDTPRSDLAILVDRLVREINLLPPYQ